MHEPTASPYPRTKRTWIASSLGEGNAGLAAVRRHVMEVYLEPLQAQVRARWRLSVEDAMDLVHGFFASRLSRDDYLERWLESDLPLRRWLWNGTCYHLKEVWRDRRRLATGWDLPDVADDRVPEPAANYDRACLLALSRAALVQAERRCREEGFGGHWELFAECRLGGSRISDAAARRGMARLSVVPMLRVPERRFREAFKGLLELEGVAVGEAGKVAREWIAGM